LKTDQPAGFTFHFVRVYKKREQNKTRKWSDISVQVPFLHRVLIKKLKLKIKKMEMNQKTNKQTSERQTKSQRAASEGGSVDRIGTVCRILNAEKRTPLPFSSAS